MTQLSKFAKYAWGVLIFNLLVILWGAFVRATGSGAGCGSHWPLCNGEVVPRAPALETIVEFTHRLTSGVAFLLVLGLFIWAFQAYPRKHNVRLGATFSLVFIITEALVGAGLVLFEWVAHNESNGRVLSMAVHLVNTFLLLASITVTAWWATTNDSFRVDKRGILFWVMVLGFVGVILLGISGAITALGDTLFPVTSVVEGLQQDFNPESHIAVRLRVWHPIIAIIVGSYIIVISTLCALYSQDEISILKKENSPDAVLKIRKQLYIKRFALFLIAMVVLQLFAGLLNLFLLAPIWLQLTHLLLADLIWLGLVLLFVNLHATTINLPVEDRQSSISSTDKRAMGLDGATANYSTAVND